MEDIDKSFDAVFDADRAFDEVEKDLEKYESEQKDYRVLEDMSVKILWSYCYSLNN